MQKTGGNKKIKKISKKVLTKRYRHDIIYKLSLRRQANRKNLDN